MNKKRKVSFYYLAQEKHILIPERNTTQITSVNSSDIKTNFEKIYNNNAHTLSNGHKAIGVETYNSKYVIEFIDYNSNMLFMKIGQQNPANTVALRDANTLESESVPMSETQLLELYTYCLIDFETLIVSYIGINGAPRISAIRSMFDNNLQVEHIYTKLAAIMTNDILQTLVRKNIISKVEISVAVPSDDILSDTIGLSPSDFDSLHHVKTRTASYKLVGVRNKNIFATSSNLAEFIASIKTKFGDSLRGLSVNARDFNESSQPYNLLQYNFTKTVALGNSETTSFSEEDFKEALENTYNINKTELVRYIR